MSGLVPSTSLLRFLRAQLRSQKPSLPIATQSCTAPFVLQRCGRAPQPSRQHDSVRPLSTSSHLRSSFWRRLRLDGQTNARRSSDGLPPLPGFLDDSGLAGRINKPSNELKLRCTEFDENGNVILVNGEFKKSELIQKYSLLPRDLRKIDSSVLPHILHNHVLVFDVYGSVNSHTQSLFMYDLEGKLRQKQVSANIGAINGQNLPYEFRALEAVLISVTGGLESEFEGMREPIVRVLRELEEDIDRDKLRYLLVYSKKLGTFEQKARLVRDAIEDLLEADDDLAAMYLTEKAAGKEREEDNHEEVELLLESYHKIADEIVQISSNLVSAIRNTEEITRAILDANRNALMVLDLKFSIGTLGLGAGMFVAALYGMNLKNFIEEDALGFTGVSSICLAITSIACVFAFRRLRKVQRVTMWGEHSSSKQSRIAGRGAWNQIDSPLEGAGPWERQDRLRQEPVHGAMHAQGGVRELTESADDIKHHEKLAQHWAQHLAKRSAKNQVSRHGIVVDGALPPVPISP